ncbi:MAG: DUF2029 domain-containing protein [Turneriella sp.]|nr:DUF2029 domain-containing protein [Turneriella sp.]
MQLPVSVSNKLTFSSKILLGFFLWAWKRHFFSIFALLPYKLSLGLYTLLNWWLVFLILFFARQILGVRDNPVPRGGVLVGVLALLLAFKPIQSNIDYAQVSILMLAFLIGFWYLLRNGHDWGAALFLFLAISIKIIPVYIIPCLLIMKDFKSFFSFCLKVGAVWLASVVISIPFRNPLHDYLEFLSALGLKSQVVETGNFAQSINSMLHRYLTNITVENEIAPKINIADLSQSTVKIIYLSLVTFSTGMFIVIAKVFKKSLPQYAHLTFLIFLSAMPLLVPLAWEHYFSINLICYYFLFLFWQSEIKGLSRLIKGYFAVSLLLILSTSRDVLGPKWSYLLGSLSAQSFQSILTVFMLSYIFFKVKSNPEFGREISDLFEARAPETKRKSLSFNPNENLRNEK